MGHRHSELHVVLISTGSEANANEDSDGARFCPVLFLATV